MRGIGVIEPGVDPPQPSIAHVAQSRQRKVGIAHREVQKRRAHRQPGHKTIVRAPSSGHPPGRQIPLRRPGQAHQVNAAQGVDGDGRGIVLTAAAQGGGVGQAGPEFIDARHKDVVAALAGGRAGAGPFGPGNASPLGALRRCVPARRKGLAGADQVGVALAVHRDALTPIVLTAPHKGGIGERVAQGGQPGYEPIPAAIVLPVKGPGRGGKIGRARGAGHVGLPGRIQGNVLAIVRLLPAQERAVHQARAPGVQPRHKGILGAIQLRIKSPGRGRPVGGAGEARHRGLARGVHGDGRGPVQAPAPEQGGVGQARAGGIQFGHKGVLPAQRCIHRAGRERQVRRRSIPGQIEAAGLVHGQVLAPVIAAAPQVSGVGQARAGGVQLEGKGVVAAAIYAVRAPGGEGQVGRASGAGDVGAALTIHGHGPARLVAAAAPEGGIDQAPAAGAHFEDKGIQAAPCRAHDLESARGGQRRGAVGVAGDIDVARGVHGHVVAAVVATLAQQPAIVQRGALGGRAQRQGAGLILLAPGRLVKGGHHHLPAGI